MCARYIDTAQSYRNEKEAGTALHDSGIAREDVYITTKYSGLNGLDVETSIQDSVSNVSIHILPPSSRSHVPHMCPSSA